MSYIPKISFAYILLSMDLSGCNILFMSKKQKVVFVTNKSDASVYNNGQLIGSGTRITQKIEKSGVREISVKTPGFRAFATVMAPTHKAGGYYIFQITDILLVIAGNPNKTY